MGAKDSQTLLAFREAEAHPGPSLIIAYSPCIAHGFPLHLGAEQQKLAVDSGYWPLFRRDPKLADAGQNPLRLDSGPPKIALDRFTANETRFGILKNVNPDRADELAVLAQADVRRRFAFYESLAAPPAAHAAPAAVDKAPASKPATP
jgi:pyruvate-ferredoxin/flavodoxin oxidoreductase